MVESNLSASANYARPFLIGIGSSAGGLESMQAFFKNMPSDSGAAIVLVTHLKRDRKSLLPEIIQRLTTMEAKHIEDNEIIKPNSVYLNPPDANVEIVGNRFILKSIEKDSNVNLPIDTFFNSMAVQYGSRAIGIILSGSGADGTKGCRSIETAGGLVVVQTPTQATYNDMPKSALLQTTTRLILPVEKMLDAINQHVANVLPVENMQLSAEELEITVHFLLPKLFQLIASRTGNDFTHYKPTTISRRIRRRMVVHQLDDFEEYVKLVDESKKETVCLLNDLLIGVTSFFRDAKAFQALESEFLPALIGKKEAGDVVRIWVVACSTGEEVYSIAMLVHECVSRLDLSLSIQIFATDIDAAAVETARCGSYSKDIQQQISPERLDRYFEQAEDGTFKIRKMIREMVLFAHHNVISDPPFIKLDILCCRNLLIYFNSILQNTLVPIFHYTLTSDGIMFLGSSETAADHGHLFQGGDNKWKIYRKRPASTFPHLSFPTRPFSQTNKPNTMSSGTNEPDPLLFVEAILEEGSAPTCVVINASLDILYVHGSTGRFLEPAQGRFSANLILSAKTGLRSELSSMIGEAFKSGGVITREDVVFRYEGGSGVVSLVVKPIDRRVGKSSELLIVIFNDATGEKTALKPNRQENAPSSKSLAELELEIRESNETMQLTIEELQSANEELKSANEELQSTNEELQSSNEELGTSKEELQSANEESTTVVLELEIRNQQLSNSSDLLKNLLDSTDVACLFLDGEYKIRTFTPRAVDLLPVEESDRGRLISNLSTNMSEKPDLRKFAEAVLDRLEPKERQVTTFDGEYYTLKGRPYRTVANVIDGVVLTFEKVTHLRESQHLLAKNAIADSIERYASVLDACQDGVVLTDCDGKIIVVNQVFSDFIGYSKNELLAMNVIDLTPGDSIDTTQHPLSGGHKKGDIEPTEFTSNFIRKNGVVVHVRVSASWFQNNATDGSKLRVAFVRELSNLS